MIFLHNNEEKSSNNDQGKLICYVNLSENSVIEYLKYSNKKI